MVRCKKKKIWLTHCRKAPHIFFQSTSFFKTICLPIIFTASREDLSWKHFVFFFSILTFFIRWYILEKGRRKGGRNFVSLTTILHIPKSFLSLLLSLLFYLSQRKNSPLSAVWWRWRRIAFYIADVTNHHVATLHRALFVFLFSCFFKLL